MGEETAFTVGKDTHIASRDGDRSQPSLKGGKDTRPAEKRMGEDTAFTKRKDQHPAWKDMGKDTAFTERVDKAPCLEGNGNGYSLN